MGGAYATLDITFGDGKPATVKYGGGILRGGDDIDLREVMAHDEVTGELVNLIERDLLGEHQRAEILQRIAYEHAKE